MYVDTAYRTDGAAPGQAFTNHELLPFLRFVCEVGSHFGGLVLFGRRDPGGTGADHAVPGAVDVVALPYYSNLTRAFEVLRAAPGTLVAMWRGLDRVDAVLVFGPYPFSPALVLFALLRRKRVVLGVRQDTMRYFRSRLPTPLATPVLAPIWVVDRIYRLLSRRIRTVVVGHFLERQYGGPRPRLLPIRISLVRDENVVSGPRELDWSGQLQLLTVGRVDSEKNPFLTVEALARLNRDAPGRFRLTWVGEGRLLEQTRERARELGVAELIDFRGFVPFGPVLLELYREAHLFVHVALTEGLPQVLSEAMASGLPIVATAVGGVPAALEDGAAGVLVPPSDADALVAAVLELSADQALRERCVERGLALAHEHSLEAEAARTAAFVE